MYLRGRQSSVKRGEKWGNYYIVFWNILVSFARGFCFVMSFRTILGYTPTKSFNTIAQYALERMKLLDINKF